MDLKAVVALAKAHSTLIVDKGSREWTVMVRRFPNATEAAMHAIEIDSFAPCTCVGCNANVECVADPIRGSDAEVVL